MRVSLPPERLEYTTCNIRQYDVNYLASDAHARPEDRRDATRLKPSRPAVDKPTPVSLGSRIDESIMNREASSIARTWVSHRLLCCRRCASGSSARSAGLEHWRRSRCTPKAPKVDFNREVRPILAKNCFACHGQDEAKRAKGLRLDRREAAVKPLKSGETAIVPGDPDSSELILRVTEEDETLRMPPRKSGQPAHAGRGRGLAGAGSSKGPSTPRTGP